MRGSPSLILDPPPRARVKSLADTNLKNVRLFCGRVTRGEKSKITLCSLRLSSFKEKERE